MNDSPDVLTDLRTIADYQFGRRAGATLFADPATIEIRRSTSGRPRQVIGPTGRLVTFGQDGRFTLGYAGGHRLFAELPEPGYRVSVGEESESYVRSGANAFAKFVHSMDETVRPHDEVLVVDTSEDTLLGVGRAELSANGMRDFSRGVAVSVREGRDEWQDR